MNKPTFNIIYNFSLSEIPKKAIANVFSNFSYFLNFNAYSFEPVSIIIGNEENCHFNLSKTFIANIEHQIFAHEKWFDTCPAIIENGNKDILGTCFYLINSLQEYAPNVNDNLGRFSFPKSYQYKFNCAEKNLVLDLFQEIATVLFCKKIPLQKSSYFLSHDIDFINSAWKDQLKESLGSGKFVKSISQVKNKLQGKDDWQNIEQIIAAEKQAKIASTFFWLPVKGRSPFPKILNADYDINAPYVQDCMSKIAHSDLHQNGLHKSISSLSLEEENTRIKNTTINRFHYLKFNVLTDFPKLSKSNLEIDCSLGFSQCIGFRNSYGLPYIPMNPKTMESYDFLEIPLHIMDSSMYYYMAKETPDKMLKTVATFIANNSSSCVLSILWHNSFYEEISYKKLLDLLHKNLRQLSINKKGFE